MGEAYPLVRLPTPALLPALNPQVTIKDHDDERATTLRRLLEKGHVSVAPLREPKLILHSHLPHVRLTPKVLSLYYGLECLYYYNLAPRIGLFSRCEQQGA